MPMYDNEQEILLPYFQWNDLKSLVGRQTLQFIVHLRTCHEMSNVLQIHKSSVTFNVKV